MWSTAQQAEEESEEYFSQLKGQVMYREVECHALNVLDQDTGVRNLVLQNAAFIHIPQTLSLLPYIKHAPYFGKVECRKRFLQSSLSQHWLSQDWICWAHVAGMEFHCQSLPFPSRCCFLNTAAGNSAVVVRGLNL